MRLDVASVDEFRQFRQQAKAEVSHVTIGVRSCARSRRCVGVGLNAILGMDIPKTGIRFEAAREPGGAPSATEFVVDSI